ncbi:MAG: holo-ACP synthase [Pseudomonadota bacterium]|nr:holo-ACP synthase [Pseudomonadota bacterium]
MIYGVGVDIVEIARIHKGLDRFGLRLVQRILSENEYREFHSMQKLPQWLATRFAAKEAFAKALGTGFRHGVHLRDISVNNDPLGRPWLEYTGQTLELVRRFDIVRSHLSLTDEREYALAFVVLEKMSIPLPK